MAVDRPMRASDGDRDRVVEILREQTAQGRLTFEEFEERIDRAYTAKTWDELSKLTEDLPVRVVFSADERNVASRGERAGPTERTRRASVPVRPQTLLLPVLIVAVVLGIAAARAWPALPFALIGVFWFAGGSCGRKGRPLTPPRGR